MGTRSDSCFASWFHLLPTHGRSVEWNEESQVEQIRKHEVVLMEIVGAMLGVDSKVDPVCIVFQNQTGIHRTETIWNDSNPIWTVKSLSLFLVSIPKDSTSTIVVEIRNSSTKLGHVEVTHSEMLKLCKEAERTEFPIKPEENSNLPSCATLALRFRIATLEDRDFLQKVKQHSVRDLTKDDTAISPRSIAAPVGSQRKVAADINFKSVRMQSIFQAHTKWSTSGQKLYRSKPYPNPDRVEETTWLSAEDLKRVTMEPSNQWVSAGCGQAGKLYVEVLGCDDLPNMDLAPPGNLTDAFVAIAYEDNFLRTEVIWNELSPRWPYWSTRAFEFSMRHPASLLFVSVFDYDEAPLNDNDPVGRVVLRPDWFKPNTTYTLQYPLQDDPKLDAEKELDPGSLSLRPARGSITLRIRLEWFNENKIMKLYLKPPPRFIINVDNRRSHSVLTYTTRGRAYMEVASVDSIKVLVSEIKDYGRSLCYTLDVLLEIFLWRGRLNITSRRSIWCPLHSLFVFLSVATVIERPDWVLPVLVFGIAWILFWINYYASRHPNPWKRAPSAWETNKLVYLGRRSIFADDSVDIAAGQGVAEASELEKLDDLKAARMAALIFGLLSFLYSVYKIYSKTSDSSVKMTTEKKNWSFMAGQLYYLHMMLRLLCSNLRSIRDLMSCKSNYTALLTTKCLMFVVAWVLLPMDTILLWVCRVWAWTVLGPVGKWIDMRYFRPWYETKAELLQRIRNKQADEPPSLPDFGAVLQSETFLKLGHAGRVKAEELYKLRDMRELLFGTYSEAIPTADNSRYPSVPLPTSNAKKQTVSLPVDAGRGYHVPGQLLEGDMIHVRQTKAPISYTEVAYFDAHDGDKKNQ